MRNFACAVALLALTACAPTLSREELVDLTHPFDASTIYWPTEEGFVLAGGPGGITDGGYYYEAHHFSAAEHGGTHIDAPIHFHAGGASVDQIPLEHLVAPGVVIDVQSACFDDRDHEIDVTDLQAWERQNGAIPRGGIVLLYTGTSRYWPDREHYLGTTVRGQEGLALLHFPGLGADAARWLIAERGVVAVGIDTASIDHGPSRRFETHQALLAANVPAFENVASLELLPPRGFQIAALPMKIGGGSGAPLRIVAFVPRSAP